MKKYPLTILVLISVVFCSKAQTSNDNDFSDLFGVNNHRQIRKAIQEDALFFNKVVPNSNDTSKYTLQSKRYMEKSLVTLDKSQERKVKALARDSNSIQFLNASKR
ncbi:MAG: hypothetical protein DI598_04225 [Pseudopedobacter saltans]|uniref:Uncharacterized protein n=1 Tax=Pseudopedobacter saltans TaxID=151895 RepID=A0A2W5FBJ6_9SPHI|nr:MAG: hypothetical protein DI598_04225 [Pseudopedobacter saltans]